MTEQNNNVQSAQDVGDVLRLRREKLDALRAEGRDPFVITKYGVTHHSEDIKASFKHGVLKLMIPKKDQKKVEEKKTIAIEG